MGGDLELSEQKLYGGRLSLQTASKETWHFQNFALSVQVKTMLTLPFLVYKKIYSMMKLGLQ